MGGEEDDLAGEFGVGATEDGDGVPGLGAGSVLELAEHLDDARVEGVGEGGFLDVGGMPVDGLAAGFEAEGFHLLGAEEGGEVLVAGGGAASVELVGGEEVHVCVDFADEGGVRGRGGWGRLGVGERGGGEEGEERKCETTGVELRPRDHAADYSCELRLAG